MLLFDERREQLREQDDRDQRQHQQSAADRADARRRCVGMLGLDPARRHEVVLVTHRLHEQEHQVEREAGAADKDQLQFRVIGARRRQRVIGQHQDQHGHRHQHREEGVRPERLELLLAMTQRAGHDADSGKAVEHQHDHRKNRVADEAGVRIPGQHQRDDQRQFDDRHREGKNQGPIRFPEPECDQFGVVDGNHHRADQQHRKGRADDPVAALAEDQSGGQSDQRAGASHGSGYGSCASRACRLPCLAARLLISIIASCEADRSWSRRE